MSRDITPSGARRLPSNACSSRDDWTRVWVPLLVVGAADGLELGGAEDVPAGASGLAAVTSNTQALRLTTTAAVRTIVAIWRKEKIGPTPIDQNTGTARHAQRYRFAFGSKGVYLSEGSARTAYI
ncbi:hypothetical protein GCM10023346_16520 [Arthrobacter gyeryongensis]|uniref:Uncharacterized protein n=1 Tax=Arthrobacter gyeryongensis TaxID=1650592 RepID=A0ABP9SB66_9MICC